MSRMTEEEKEKLSQTFEAMGAKPKMDSPEDLEAWMMGFLASKGKIDIKQEQPGEKTSGHFRPSPRIASFSGEDGSKTDTTFDLWKYEVECLKASKIHSEAVICESVRRSVKGKAAHILKRLGTSATVDQILKKFEDVFGEVDAGETLLAEFYATRQGKQEDVTAWGCRLEDILEHVQERRKFSTSEANEMLRSKFWNGLQQRLKDSSRHKYDSTSEFDQLRKEIRVIEKEHKIADDMEKSSKPSKAQTHMAAVTSDGTTMQELQAMVCKLTTQVEIMQKQIQKGNQNSPKDNNLGKQVQVQGQEQSQFRYYQPRQTSPSWQPTTFNQPSGQGPRSQPPNQHYMSPSLNRPPAPWRSPYPGQQHGTPYGSQQPTTGRGSLKSAGLPTCYKCNQPGHLKKDCPRRYEPTCFICGQIGHRQQECTSPHLNWA